ncbi:MAG: hypothetical protein EHM64_09730 [Ignavibacteriae bacterium]|nr:MAG: hypothetical protein EHM64_09730 [Ignavibacteriota bacterium]
MFIGHFAVGLGAKKAAPRIKLGTLFFAAQFLDLLWPLLILAGIEHVRINPHVIPFLRLELYDYPVSHSLLTSLLWSGLIGSAYYLLHKNRRHAVILGCVVLSHWLLDFISHVPDLPLAPGSSFYVGLGLWNSTVATIVIESLLFIAGFVLYLRSTTAKDKTGVIALWTLVIFLAVSYISNIIAPPPADAGPVGWLALSMWIFIPWGNWIDRHRASHE